MPGSNVTWASYWVEGVSAKSTNKREAWEFIKFLQEDENLVKLYNEASKTPGRIFGEPYPKVSLASTLESDPIVGAYIKGAAYMRSFPMASRTFDNGLNDQIIKAYEDAINSVADGANAKVALSTTAKNVGSILGRFGVQ